jgi:hypothetical protein
MKLICALSDCVTRRSPTRSLSRLVVGILLFAMTTESAQAAGGIVVTDISGRAYAVVIDKLGRIVTAGSTHSGYGFALTRYNSDGTLDTTYGAGGVVIADAIVPSVAPLLPKPSRWTASGAF